MKEDRGELWGMINLLRLNMEKIMTLDLLEQQRRVAQQGAQRAAGAAQQGDEEGDQGLYRIEAFDPAEALEGAAAEGAAGGGGGGGASGTGARGGAARSPAAAGAQLPGGEGDEGFDLGLQVHTLPVGPAWLHACTQPADFALPLHLAPACCPPAFVLNNHTLFPRSILPPPRFSCPLRPAPCRRWLSRSWGCWLRSSRLSPAGRGTARRLMCWQRRELQVRIGHAGRHWLAGCLPAGRQPGLRWLPDCMGQWHPCPLYSSCSCSINDIILQLQLSDALLLLLSAAGTAACLCLQACCSMIWHCGTAPTRQQPMRPQALRWMPGAGLSDGGWMGVAPAPRYRCG